ncbi:Multidrug/solvent efflux pump outer membrane protein MepC [bioreactor metagenome]|uniref:Multidrug/solvent efflux pump outer membrane protein MepC n=1 Tax=bioreactor metagenome TaxID=1076179 RepID=A0A644ZZT1_9ZZZZ
MFFIQTSIASRPAPPASARGTFRLRWGALGLAMALAGCSTLDVDRSLPGANAQVSVPQDWAGTSSAASAAQVDTQLVQWWRQLGDAQLTALVEQSLAANPGLRGAQQAVLQARAQTAQAEAGLLPSVNASGSAQRARQGNSGTANRFNVGADASWEIDLFGRLQSGVTASRADLAATQAALAGARVSLAAEVALAYVDLRNGQQRLQIARNNLKSQQETLQITEWRQQAGLTTSLVVEQSRTQVQQTAAQIPALEAGIAQSRHSLAVLTGQAPAALDAQLAEARDLPQLPAELTLRFPADTLRQRPDVLQAGEQVRAALARVDQAQAARYPSLSLSGSFGLGAATLGALSGGSAVAASILGGLSVPVFDGGARRAQVDAQVAALEQSRASYQSTVLSALQDVEDALAALQGDRQKLQELDQAAQAAANANLLAQHQYTSGLVDFQTVLETQRSLLSAQDGVASTRASLLADHVRLYKALGGGWSAEAEHAESAQATNDDEPTGKQAGVQ